MHVEVRGLEPGRWYHYRFMLGQATSATGRTCTAPALDALPGRLRVAFASCQRWEHGHYAAWRHVCNDQPDLVLFLGDYIYEYPSPPTALRRHEGGLLRTLGQYRERYAQYKSDPALQDAHAACPWLLVWDDHEVENDYAGGHPTTPLGADMGVLRAVAYQAYWEHQPFAKAQRPSGPDMRIVGRLEDHHAPALADRDHDPPIREREHAHAEPRGDEPPDDERRRPAAHFGFLSTNAASTGHKFVTDPRWRVT